MNKSLPLIPSPRSQRHNFKCNTIDAATCCLAGISRGSPSGRGPDLPLPGYTTRSLTVPTHPRQWQSRTLITTATAVPPALRVGAMDLSPSTRPSGRHCAPRVATSSKKMQRRSWAATTTRRLSRLLVLPNEGQGLQQALGRWQSVQMETGDLARWTQWSRAMQETLQLRLCPCGERERGGKRPPRSGRTSTRGVSG